MQKRHWVLVGIALFGALLAAYALSLHYAPAGSKICNISETFNCDKVNKSPWATVLGIPVALLGVLSYLTVLLLIIKERTLQKALSFTKKDYWMYLTGMFAIMLCFQAYLTFAEIMYIHAYCLVCLGSQACVIALTILGVYEVRLAR